MKLYKTTLSPESNFATPLKGDTLFGQLCWSIKYVFGKSKLNALLQTYDESPFLVVSDGFVSGYLPKPKMPSPLLGENTEEKKISRKKIWLTLEQLQNGKFLDAKTDEDIKNKDRSAITVRNSLNYKTFRTSDEGTFAPYGEKEFFMDKKDIYFLLDESKLTIRELEQAFDLLSFNGYGKDTTIGKGRFTYTGFAGVSCTTKSKTFLTLSPFSPLGIECKELYYEPFTRFGKLGGERAFKNAFKKPILLADTASVIHFDDTKNLRYVGHAIKGISDTHPDTVHQGYSIVLPIKDLL